MKLADSANEGQMDAIDQKIIAELQADGRLTNQELSDRVGLSPSPCLRRVRNLEAAGVIQGYTALVDQKACGYPITCLVRIRLATHSQETVQAFIEHYQQADFSCGQRQQFNASIHQRFEAVRSYIVAHYRVNSRTDTEYWLANSQNNRIPRSLFDILQVWMSGKNLSDELDRQQIDNYYPSVSWHCLLAGYGIYPAQQQLMAPNAEASKHNMAEISEFIRRCGLNFPGHKESLMRLAGE